MFPKKILSVVETKKFSLNKSSHYHLLINIGHGLMKIGCIEDATQTCLLLGVYTLPSDTQHPNYIKSLEQLYHEDCLLIKKDWFSIILSISNKKFTLLPHLLLSPKDLATYLHAACGIDPHEEVAVFTHVLDKISVVFAENIVVLEWFRKCYTDNNFYIIHQVNAMMEGIQAACPAAHAETLFIWLAPCQVHIAAYDKGKLLYYNIFSYETADDFLGYVSAVVQMLAFKRHSCKTWVSGLIEKTSPAYCHLKAYMPRTTLKTKINFLSTNNKFFNKRNAPLMRYFDLMSSWLCLFHRKETK